VVNELVNKILKPLKNRDLFGYGVRVRIPRVSYAETLEITTFQGFFSTKNQGFYTNVFCAIQSHFVGQVVNKTIKIGQWI